MGDDVDFVVGVPAPDRQEDAASPGGPGRYRALVLLGVLVVAAAVIATLVRHHRGAEHHAKATPTPSPPALRTLPTVADVPGLPAPGEGTARCPRANACTITYRVPDAVIAAVHARFPDAALTAGRTQLATPAGRPSDVEERNVQFRADKVTLVVAVSEPGDREGTVPVGTRTVIRTIADGRYLTVRATVTLGDPLPDYAVLQALLDDNRLLTA